MKQTISIPNSWLNQWHDPDGLFKQVQRTLEPLDNCRLFSDPAFQPFFDTWIAAKFAAIRSTVQPCKVRLLEPGSFPDFELLVNGRNEPFEATEADRLDRRVGDEYRKGGHQNRSGLCGAHDVSEHDEFRQCAVNAIEVAVIRKVSKKYGCKVHLVILVNVPTFVENSVSIEKFVELTRPAANMFLSTWILWSNKVIRTWPSPIQIVSPFPRHA
jgi:hypothetical protein